MARFPSQRVLLIGDAERSIYLALLGALPGVQVTSVPNLFDGIAELSSGSYSTVLAAAEPIERRPEAAVRVLRQVAGECRVILFGHPTLELLSRKMLQFGCDDYVVTPASSGELQQMLASTPLRIVNEADASEPESVPAETNPPLESQVRGVLEKLPLADLLLDALLQHPQDAPAAAIREINSRVEPAMRLLHTAAGAGVPEPLHGRQTLSHDLHLAGGAAGALHLLISGDEDPAAARHALAQLAFLFGKLLGLQDRHNRLQKLAITDELTNVHNARYFRHFLTRIIEKGRATAISGHAVAVRH